MTPGNTDDRKPVPEMTKNLVGRLFRDQGYISQTFFESLFERGLELITKRRKDMKNALMPLLDEILLRKRLIIETANDPLKNLCQIEHSRHRSPLRNENRDKAAFAKLGSGTLNKVDFKKLWIANLYKADLHQLRNENRSKADFGQS
ncbi:transposase [Leptolyngbya sp. FACHB-321]|nr:transposase [Phormidium sp. FACHB-77]MBD2035220.1 transposase [Leptolyngbya sp. FACHB-321]MBD2054344.1 transposase [Leptolyngbya sp. FACHB-60]